MKTPSPPRLARSWRDLQPAWQGVILKFRNRRWKRIQEMTMEWMEVMGGLIASPCLSHLTRWDSIWTGFWLFYILFFFNSFFAISHSNFSVANWLHIAKNENTGSAACMGWFTLPRTILEDRNHAVWSKLFTVTKIFSICQIILLLFYFYNGNLELYQQSYWKHRHDQSHSYNRNTIMRVREMPVSVDSIWQKMGNLLQNPSRSTYHFRR